MTATPEQVAEASSIGWRPMEQFRGNPDNWVDADVYLERGKEVLPLLKANNKRLENDLAATKQANDRLAAEIAELRGSMNEFAEFSHQQLKEKLEEQRVSLKRQIREAKREDDDSRVEELEEQLDENEEARAALKPPAKKEAQTPPPEPPEFKAWKETNPWFGADPVKTKMAETFAIRVAAEGKKGQAFYDGVDELMREAYPQRKAADKTEDGRPGGGGGEGGSSNDSSFNALPAEAKAYAKQQAAKFVGPNKMFKDEKAWFAHFTKQYNAN